MLAFFLPQLSPFLFRPYTHTFSPEESHICDLKSLWLRLRETKRNRDRVSARTNSLNFLFPLSSIAFTFPEKMVASLADGDIFSVIFSVKL